MGPNMNHKQPTINPPTTANHPIGATLATKLKLKKCDGFPQPFSDQILPANALGS